MVTGIIMSKKKKTPEIKIEVHVHIDEKEPMGRRPGPGESGGWAKGMYLKGREREERSRH
jgi:hypothetical protein